ncbi:hypothetical protein NW762_007979 [Fusarium torreyae]|uniref:Alpha/beta hydrolase fold-3 domain-containing protein n=1 Tax=Fusarium torreyae TaxID=1237075 RepID=A0A9W8RZW2_9HYPO|nr:hypothetical protein NW762_007979 [Fusarium torreyae]
MAVKWTEYSIPDPDFEQYYSHIKPMPKLDDIAIPVSVVRSMVPTPENLSEATSQDGVKRSQISIPTRDGSTIMALLYQPQEPPTQGSPLIVFYHGGGWCLGSPLSEDKNCKNAVKRYGAVCVNVDYRLAPEFAFPIPVNDAWDALKWIAGNSQQLGADTSRGFMLYGESAGANLAIVAALLARDEGLNPPLTGLSLSIPALLSAEAVPEKYRAEYLSYEQSVNTPGLDTKSLDYLIYNYNPDKKSPLFSCFNWPTGHCDLPPTYFQVCGKYQSKLRTT